MSDTTTQSADDTMAQVMRYAALLAPQQTYAPPAPVDRSVASLLGEALGGGTTGLAGAERESAGSRALLNFGLNMLAGSGPSVMPRGFGQIFAQGAGGAEQSLAGSEAVAASRLAAQQAYQEKQQELQLERVKAAIPLLKLEQAAKLANMPSSIAPAPRADAAGGDVGAPIVARDPKAGTAGQQANNPGNIMLTPGAPVPAGASGAIPLPGGRYVAAFPDVPTGVAAHSDLLTQYAQSGIGTIRDAVTRWVGDPKADLTSYVADVAKAAGVGPDDKVDLSDPKIQRAILLAQQPHESGKPWLSAADVDKGLALAAARRAGVAKAGGGPVAAPTAAAPPTGPGGAPAAAPGTSAPVITDQPAGPGFAGPGAPSTARTQAPSPAVPGDVNAIIKGMVGAGADPTTLAPPGTPPAPVQVAGPGAPTATPAEPPPFSYVFHPPPPGVLPGGNLTPDEARVVNDARNSYTAAIKAAAFADDPGKARAEAEATLQHTLDSELGIRAGRTKEAADKLATWVADDYKQQQAVHAKSVEDFYKNRDQQRELEKVRITADETRKTAEAAQIGARNQKMLETLDTEANSARGAISELDGLKALSDNVKTPSVWATMKWGDTTVGNRMAQAGLLDKGELGATQMLQTGISGVIKTLRQNMAMGSLSDRDLTFIEGMGPNLYQDQDTRSAVIGYLKQAQQAKIRFNVEVNKEMSRPGTNMAEALDRAEKTMEKKYPIVPQMPQEIWDHRNDPDPAWAARRQEWAADNNIRPGSMWRSPGGGLQLVRSPRQQ